MKMLKLVASILLLCAVGFGLWSLGNLVLDWLQTLEKEVAAAAITGLIGLFGLLYVQWSSKRKEIADSHRAAKIEVYETFFDIVERFMSAEERGEKNLDPESDKFPADLKAQFTKLSRGMIVWASPAVIKAWSEFRENASDAKSPTDTILAFDKVLQAIRSGLGNSNFGLSRGDVVKLYISNPGDLNV